jgi:polyisoprenoid-binding protein YceI
MISPRILAALAASFWATAASAAGWIMEPGTSSLTFVASYEGQAAPGRFRDIDTRLDFDPEHPDQGHLHVSVSMASADMDSADINGTIRAPEWFDVPRHPRAEFDSARIVRERPGHYVAQGRLTLKGVAREVAVPFAWTGSGPAATMAGQLDLDRTAFNIGTGEWATGRTIGLQVKVRFSLHLRKAD